MSATNDRVASVDCEAMAPAGGESAGQQLRIESTGEVTQLHRDAIVIDGLIVAKWGRELLENMQRGGLTAANCTASIWEGFQDTVDSIVRMNDLFDANADLLLKVRSTADILRAKREGKTGVILGFQNAVAFEDRIEYVQVFKEGAAYG